MQFWTTNVGLLLHDAERLNNLSVRVNYGSGFHTGVATNELLPEHTTVDATLSRTFKVPGRPEVAFDVFQPLQRHLCLSDRNGVLRQLRIRCPAPLRPAADLSLWSTLSMRDTRWHLLLRASAGLLLLGACRDPQPAPVAAAPVAAPPRPGRGLGEIMSLQQMRHSKLWFAGQAKNWELAA